jgi:hypothetical protein
MATLLVRSLSNKVKAMRARSTPVPANVDARKQPAVNHLRAVRSFTDPDECGELVRRHQGRMIDASRESAGLFHGGFQAIAGPRNLHIKAVHLRNWSARLRVCGARG